MDCRDGDKTWDWQEKNGIGMAVNFDTSQCIWNEVTQNEEDLSYMFDETTPVKACKDMVYKVMGNGEASKEFGELSSLQVKRRRML